MSAGHLYLVAGEPSGDIHAAHLLEELRVLAPDLACRGLGGPRMAAAGLDLKHDLASEAIMGLFPVIRSFPMIWRTFHDAVRDLREDPPRALVLVDYPGFNLRLAARARALGVPVIYYISPQVWAWAPWRLRRIARNVDLMLLILPFEESFYAGSGIRTAYVGHPLMDRLERSPVDEAFVARLRRAGGDPLVGILPGSRRHVVQSLMPVFGDAAARLVRLPGMENTRFLVALAQEGFEAEVRKHLPRDLPVEIVAEHSLEVMAVADLCLTASGTTTLELAGMGTPFVIGYRVSPVLYLFGRLVLTVKHIGLVNLVAEKPLVPEHVGVRSFAAAAARDLQRLWTKEDMRRRQIQGLEEVRRRLSGGGSYRRAAEEIVRFIAEA